MAIDMRDSRTEIKAALETVRGWEKKQYETPWGWSIEALNKNELRVMWGYFKYIEEPGIAITVKEEEQVLADDKPEHDVIAKLPCGISRYAFVGDNSWDDCKTIGEGIALAIQRAAAYAMSAY